MVRTCLAALVLLGSHAAQAQQMPSGDMSDRAIQMLLEMGQDLEERAHGDLNGDGATDTVYVASSPDARFVHVMLATPRGPRQVGVLKLEPNPVRSARLSVANLVLTVSDDVGASMGMASVYRYRFERRSGTMRLIGLDAKLIDRTLADDGYEMSWNLLTGDLMTRLLRVVERQGRKIYQPAFEDRSKRRSKPLSMEQTPDPETVMIAIRRR